MNECEGECVDVCEGEGVCGWVVGRVCGCVLMSGRVSVWGEWVSGWMGVLVSGWICV